MPDAGSDENVAAFANRTNDDAVLEKTDSEENGEKEDTEGKDTEGKDAGENSKDKSEGGEGLEKAESGSGEQGDSGKDGNSAENGDSQDENANPGNGESDEKDDSGKTDSGSSGGNADLNEDADSSNGKTDESKEDVKTDEKTEEEIDEKEGFWRKVRVRWVLDEEESQASRYDGENPGIYLFRAELKSSNYEVDEDELPVIQITVLEEEQVKTTLEFVPLEPIRFSRLEAKNPISSSRRLLPCVRRWEKKPPSGLCRVSRGNWMQKTATILNFGADWHRRTILTASMRTVNQKKLKNRPGKATIKPMKNTMGRSIPIFR